MNKLFLVSYKVVLLCMVIAIWSSCSKNENLTSFPEPESTLSPENDRTLKAEEAYPNKIGELQTIRIDNNSSFQYSKIEGKNVFEGDIILTDEQLALIAAPSNGDTRATISNNVARRWEDGIMFYEIVDESTRSRAMAAMEHIAFHSKVRFVKRTNQADYVRFVQGSGCFSNVGRVGGPQDIMLNTALIGGCSVGSTIHEICHALGFYHEQSRPDRGNYVKIHRQNILPGYEGNFNIGFQAVGHGPFDFGSIMMYPWNAFSNSIFGLSHTITKVDGSRYSTQRNGLSIGDMHALNTMYPFPFSGGQEWLNGPYDYSPYTFRNGDVNNDGRADIIGIRPNDERIVVWLSTGNGFSGGQEWLNGPHDYSPYNFHVGDINNDGRTDIIGIRPNDERIVVWLSTGSGFTGGQEWHNGPHDYSPYGFHVGDINNDGRADLIGIRPNDERVVVWLSTGSGFTGGQEWLNGPYDYSPYTFRTGDINNDGRTDIIGIRANEERIVVWLSTGSGFTGGQEWHNGVHDYSAYVFQVGDVNNDGRADIVGFRPNQERAVAWLSNGNGFTGGQEWLDGPYDYSSYGFQIGDVDNNGQSDLIAIRPNDERFVVWLKAED